MLICLRSDRVVGTARRSARAPFSWTSRPTAPRHGLILFVTDQIASRLGLSVCDASCLPSRCFAIFSLISVSTSFEVTAFQVIDYNFYFPAVGFYQHYPVHVSKMGKVFGISFSPGHRLCPSLVPSWTLRRWVCAWFHSGWLFLLRVPRDATPRSFASCDLQPPGHWLRPAHARASRLQGIDHSYRVP